MSEKSLTKIERPLRGKSEQELVESARMHDASLSELHLEIAARGIEIDTNHYTSGRYETRYYRKTETDL